MYINGSLSKTKDSFELLHRSYHYPNSEFLQFKAEVEFQRLLVDLWIEIEHVLINYKVEAVSASHVNASTARGVKQRLLSVSVTEQPLVSITTGRLLYKFSQ